jgi:hypothetical protein
VGVARLIEFVKLNSPFKKRRHRHRRAAREISATVGGGTALQRNAAVALEGRLSGSRRCKRVSSNSDVLP